MTQRLWTRAEDNRLRLNAARVPLSELAGLMDRSKASLKARAIHLRLPHPYFAPERELDSPLVFNFTQVHIRKIEPEKDSIVERMMQFATLRRIA